MKKMKRQDKAIGFAVYLDEIEKFVAEPKVFDVDVAIEYGNQSADKVSALVKQITDGGESVIALKKVPENEIVDELLKEIEKI